MIHGGPPPQPPELPEGAQTAPSWPARYAPLGFIGGFFITITVALVVSGIAAALGANVENDPPGLIVALTLAQAVILCVTAIYLAARVRRPRAWHFGLRRAPFWSSLGWAAAGFASFLVFVVLYDAIFSPDGEQDVTESLGADGGTLALIAAGVVVIVVAPIAEEFFFRGFFYRALRSRMGLLAAAGIDGIVFGLIHYSGPDTLELLPVLGFLGFAFCLVYERSGTLYTVIGLHALNNSIAYGVSTDQAAVSLVLGPLMLLGCMVLPRLIHERR